MKTKAIVLMFTLVFALAMMAQTATQTTPAPAAGDKANTCACCNHDKTDAKSGDKCPMMKDGKMADGKSCCGDGCCKDGKCDMAAHKGHDMASGKSCCGEGCCKGGKCEMAAHKDGKAGCCGDKCPMMKGEKSTAKSSGNDDCCQKTAAVSCCAKGAACCRGGYMPCCGHDKTAA
jgi:hypothetical protein